MNLSEMNKKQRQSAQEAYNALIEKEQNIRLKRLNIENPVKPPMKKQTLNKRDPYAPYRSQGEFLLAGQLKELKLEFEHDYKFEPDRKYLADFALLEHNLLIELQGGTKKGKRGHSDEEAYEKDCEKMSAAVAQGFRVVWYTTAQVMNGTAKTMIERIIKAKTCHG